ALSREHQHEVYSVAEKLSHALQIQHKRHLVKETAWERERESILILRERASLESEIATLREGEREREKGKEREREREQATRIKGVSAPSLPATMSMPHIEGTDYSKVSKDALVSLVQGCTQQLHEARRQAAENKTIIALYASQVESCEAEIAARVARDTEREGEREEQVSVWSARVSAVQETLAEKEREREGLKDTAAAAIEKADTLSRELATAHNEVAVEKERNAAFVSVLEGLRAIISESSEEARVEREAATLREEEWERERESMQTAMELLTSVNAELKAEISTQAETLSTVEPALAQALERVSALESSLQEREREAAEAKAAAQDAQKWERGVKVELEALRAARERERLARSEEAVRLGRERERERKRLGKERAAFKERLEEMERRHREAMEEYKSRSSDALGDYDNMKQRLKACKARNASLTASVTDLQQSLEDAQDRGSEIAADAKLSREKLATSQEQIATLKSVLSAKKHALSLSQTALRESGSVAYTAQNRLRKESSNSEWMQRRLLQLLSKHGEVVKGGSIKLRATVVRGPDWRLGDQDGRGIGRLNGYAKGTRDHVSVTWNNTGKRSICRAGSKGCYDLVYYQTPE
ncbi:hypothetical protein KIPB_006501, partial [Kipferlia bialata]